MLSTDQGTPMEPLNPEDFVLDPAKALKGKELFTSVGCSACHQIGSEGTAPPTAAKSLATLNPNGGCLSEFPGKQAAKYQLSATQKTALQKTLSTQAQLAQPRSPQQSVLQTMAAMNCFACH